MKLYLLQNPQGDKLEIAPFPSTLLSSRNGLANFLRLHASRLFGNEGRDWRVCQQPRARLNAPYRFPDGS